MSMFEKLTQGTGGSPLRGLANARNSRSKRISSYDVTGDNADARPIPPGETLTIADIEGAGCINHIWFTIDNQDFLYPRKMIVRMYWDGEENPSVECPVGDFFGVGHGKVNHYVAMATNMITNPKTHHFNAGMNCYFPMPFAKGAKITMTNESEFKTGSMYYYVDYEEVDEQGEDALRFHAQWNREENTNGPGHDKEGGIKNLDGKDNYVILDAEGRGHYVGCNVSIHNWDGGWPGEGDDMIFIDGEKWPPSLHGTGTEDYFCAAWGFPSGEYAGPYHGISLQGSTKDWTGKWTVYRHHIEDPVVFWKSIKVTMEHRHGNAGRDDWSSVGYWYQAEPHKPFQKMLPVENRLPKMDEKEQKFYDLSVDIARRRLRYENTDIITHDERRWGWQIYGEAEEAYGSGDFDKAIRLYETIITKFEFAEARHELKKLKG